MGGVRRTTVCILFSEVQCESTAWVSRREGIPPFTIEGGDERRAYVIVSVCHCGPKARQSLSSTTTPGLLRRPDSSGASGNDRGRSLALTGSKEARNNEGIV